MQAREEKKEVRDRGAPRCGPKRAGVEVRAAALTRLGFLLSAARQPAEAAQHIVDAAFEFFQWDASFLVLYKAQTDHVSDVVNIDTVQGVRQHVPAELQDKPPSPFMRKVIEQGAQLVLREKAEMEGPATVPFGDKARLSLSLMFVPLRLENQCMGVLSVQSYEREAFQQEDLDILQGLADHAAGALGRLQAEAELRAAQDKLSAYAQELEKTVELRTQRLQETINELEHVSYALKHDMRAPLRAMQGYAQLAKEELAGTHCPQTMEYLRLIGLASERLDQLIQDSLTYNHAVLGKMQMGPVNIGKLLEGLMETYPQFQAANADIRIKANLPVVLGNQSALTQCFSNLLGNAVKFVRPGQRPLIQVRAERHGERVRIWVEDQGIGIPQKCQERVFLMWHRGTQVYEGTGIGLAIVKKLIQRMGGEVGVESEEGQGSRFWVELKLDSRM